MACWKRVSLTCMRAIGLLVSTGLALALAGCNAQPKPPSKVGLDESGATVINGRAVFPIGFTLGPPPDGRTPTGKSAYRELRDAGAIFLRTGPSGPETWDDAYIAKEQRIMDAAAASGMFCLPWLKELSSIKPEDTAREAKFRRVVHLFKDHPAMGVWKGADEPEWGKEEVPPLERAREIVCEIDPNHPMWIVHAPRGSVESLRRYNTTMDIVGVDIYPISYPPGTHSVLPKKDIGIVGDFTKTVMEVADGKKPVWMTLQIAWSGVSREGKTLRYPTFPEERFMAYHAIINGARGLIFFGGHLQNVMTEEDRKLGWNWRFWDRVLKPVVEELGDKSPLHPALVAPDSKISLKVDQSDIEFVVRETPNDIFILACKRGGETVRASFAGLASTPIKAEVMFEPPRTVEVKNGTLTDWFAPFEVHVYRIPRKS